MKNKYTSQSVLICLFVVLAFAVYGSPARATCMTTYWTGAVDNDWFNPSNWDPCEPDSSTDAFINNGGKVAINESGATARSLTLGANIGDSGTVLVDGRDASLELAGCYGEDDPVVGALYVGYGGSGTLNITNGATVTSAFGYVAALGGELVDSNGAVTVDGEGSAWVVNADCTGTSRLFIGGTATSDGGTALLNVTNGGTVIASSHAPSGGVKVGISGTLADQGGTVLMYGQAPYAVVRGTLAPERLRIDGYLSLTSTATTLSNVTPDGAGSVEVVHGSATLNGRLSVTMTGDFSLAPTRFTLLHADYGLGNPHTTFGSVSISTQRAWAGLRISHTITMEVMFILIVCTTSILNADVDLKGAKSPTDESNEEISEQFTARRST